ncbi:MAG TPA: bifunctional alpha,alpha-trehalose-phosphate synthase (UDP-forming)/trehalose-phosphatase [Gaiellaceae bacterium]|nr:bifunctional alpha,alpha-trehalose-phosphate synthase (UDP-forming)/trehalose-phosphatase [Gaiellaceae bacterium]
MASNRSPFTLSVEEDEQEGLGLRAEASAGGLVTALTGSHGAPLWVGWPGAAIPEELEAEATALAAAEGCVPVFVTESEQELYYGRICNETLWPLFHYFVDRIRFTTDAWAAYVQVNERFAETIAGVTAPRGRVWIHDFHLALVPQLLRSLRPDLAIGFFLHVPFPSSEIYRLLPTRVELLEGLLGADYVGFHTGDYARHFRSSCLRVLGIEPDPGTIQWDNRTVGVGVHPIGIAVAGFRESLNDPAAPAVRAEIAARYEGRQLVLGIERLDYTKGIPQKLDAFERILEQDPTRAGEVTMLQVLVPSRLESTEYQDKRDEIEMRIAHINGRFGEVGRVPIEYLYRPLSRAELVGLYARADVMMVTPLRDGMNLVAQEFVLCQTAPESGETSLGTLLLSEFAGAAQVLPGAVLVNPWDAEDLAERLVEALALPLAERRRRLELMAGRVEELDSARWAEGFLARLERYASPAVRAVRPLDEGARQVIGGAFEEASSRTLLLDYDGTLRELVDHPDLAVPTAEIRELLERLTALPETDVHIVSGRTRDSLDAWLGDLPVYLCAEHGYVVRPPGGSWTVLQDVDLSWLPRVERLLRRVSADVPGTLVERKAASVAWHYRRAEPEYGAWRARELLVALEDALAGVSAEVLPGLKVVEVRARGVNKGAYVERLLAERADPGSLMLAAGDDLTDTDLFRALPEGAIAIHVGSARPFRQTRLDHEYVLGSPRALRQTLRRLVADLSFALPRRAAQLEARS